MSRRGAKAPSTRTLPAQSIREAGKIGLADAEQGWRMNILRRLWTGVVAAMAGVALAVVMQMIGQMAMGLAMNDLPWIVLGCSVSGFLVGVALGPGRVKAASKR